MVVLLDVILGIDFEHLPKYNYCTGKTGPEIFRFGCVVTAQSTGSPGDNSKWVPPDSISNSEVKPLSADDSVGSPHVTKLSGTILHCVGFAQTRRGVGQDARNKVGHRWVL